MSDADSAKRDPVSERQGVEFIAKLQKFPTYAIHKAIVQAFVRAIHRMARSLLIVASSANLKELNTLPASIIIHYRTRS